jgi:hypothetical protein
MKSKIHEPFILQINPVRKKTITVFLSALILIGISSCQKTKDDINKATEFDMSYSTEVPIPSNPGYTVTTPVDFDTPEISTQSQNRFVSENTTKDLIDEIKLSKFLISNSAGNLNFLKSISIYIKTSGKGEQLVATKSDIPQNTTSISADLQDVNIKEYIFNDKIQFKVKLTITSGLSGEQKLKVEQTVHVKGKRVK